MLWDYARLSRNDPAEAARVLEVLLEQEPNRAEVRIELAQIQLALKQPAAALETVARVGDVAGADAVKFHKVLAYAYAHSGDCERAREAANRWRAEAGGQADAESARLIAYLDSVARLRAPEGDAETQIQMRADAR
jgi:predicted Zn-dependent protease